MPLYEYRCENGHTFEVMQKMSDDPVQSCETCGAPVQRVFHPVAVHFKGSGFYNTDYGKKRRGAAGDDSGGSDSGGGGGEKKSDSGGDSKKTETTTSSSD
jgi:putative FmdB family regulatory protein